MTHHKNIDLHWLSPAGERALLARQEIEIKELLPTLGPLFGLAVVTFGLWDYFIDAEHALATFMIRILLVSFGALAYFPSRLHWTTEQRSCHIYWTHTCAIILCEYLLKHGFLYGLAGITSCLFVTAIISQNLRSFFFLLSVPTVMLLILSALKSNVFEYTNQIIFYGVSALSAYVLMMVIHAFRRSAFLLETKLIRTSRHDTLTDAYNRSYLEELAMHEIASSRRHGMPLAVAMLDIDHFKHINDTYGHAIGDQAIKSLVSTCLSTMRKIDHFGRIGGEEFAYVMPATNEAGALECSERLRQAIAALRINTPAGTIQFTVSIGIALLHDGHANWTDILKDADHAMYQAKHAGRNQICIATCCHQSETAPASAANT